MGVSLINIFFHLIALIYLILKLQIDQMQD
jgi:hypothetical protein